MDIAEQLYGYLFVAVFSAVTFGIYIVYKRFTNRPTDSPILASNGLLEGELIPATSGTIHGFDYRIILNGEGRMMYMLDLGYNSNLHIVAYGDKSKLDFMIKNSLEDKWLTSVILEGDFPDYFHLYCTPSRHIELLQMFSPDTMANFIDFCRAYDFEIAYETLYISQVGNANDEDDTTGMLDDATKFVEENSYLLHHLQQLITIEK